MSPSSPESAISLQLVDARVVLQQVADHEHACRPRAAASTARSASATDWASGFSTKQCLPASSTRDGQRRRGWAPAWRARPRRASGRSSRSSSSPVKRVPAERGAQPRARRPRRASQHHAQLAAGQRVEVAGEVRAPVAEADDADATAPARRHSRTTLRGRDAAGDAAQVEHAAARARRHRVVVDARVRGDDHRQVGAVERLVERRDAQAELGQLGHVRVVVDDVGAEPAAAAAMIFSAGDSRMSPDARPCSATPSSAIRAPAHRLARVVERALDLAPRSGRACSG